MRFVAFALVFLVALPWLRPDRRDRRDRRFPSARVAAGPVYVDAGVTDLNGFSIPLAIQCTGGDVYTQAPRQRVEFARASSAYCTKSDGTVTLLTTDQPRRERAGLLVEPAGANDLTDPRDLSQATWTKTNMTAAFTANGADGVANSATTLTATAGNGTVTQTFTVGGSRRSTSVFIKRRTGSGAVYVSRDNFSAQTDVSADLSSTTWKRVRSGCGGYGDDSTFSRIDNCIAVSALTSTAANPTVGIKLATSGDAVDVDFVQDEAQVFATSPMAGFSRAKDLAPITLDGGLPTTQGELSYDYALEWTAPDGISNDFIDSRNFNGDCGLLLEMNEGNGVTIAQLKKAGVAATQLLGNASNLLSGNAMNMRLTWGSGNARLWRDGLVQASDLTGTVPDIDCHTTYTLGETQGIIQMGGWVTRVRWTSGAFSSFKGSAKTVVLVGDSITEAVNGQVLEGQRPHQVLSTLITPNARAFDKYVWNAGTSGNTIDQCDSNARYYIDEAITHGLGATRVVVFQCGTNSVEADGAASVFGKIKTLVLDSIDAGVPILPATITPYVARDTFITGVNWRLRAFCADAGLPYAETYQNMELPAGSGILNPAYDYGDNIHVNGAGATQEANVWFLAGRDAGDW